MKIRSWIPTCSSSAVEEDDTEPPPKTTTNQSPISLISETSTSSSSTTTCSSTPASSISSLHSNLSLQTLPSVPSLQFLSPQTLNLTISHFTLNPFPACHVTSLALHNHLLYAASHHHITVFDITNPNFTRIDTFNDKHPSSGSVKSINFFKNRVFTAHQDSKIRLWKLTPKNTHKLVAVLPTFPDKIRRFISPKNHVTIRRHKTKLWIQHHDAVSALAVGHNFICSVSWDRTLKIWGSSNFACSQSLQAHDDAINAVVLSPDGSIYTGSADRRIRVWAKPAGEKRHVLVATLEKHKSAVNALALSRDGSVLFSSSCDRSILVWEREDSASHMSVTGALRGHDRAILCLITVDDDSLISGSADRTVRIWRRGDGGSYCCLTVLEGHLAPVRSLAAVVCGGEFGGGIKVFSGSFDGVIKVWQVTVSNLNSPSHQLLKWIS